MTTTARVILLIRKPRWAWCAVEERVPGKEPRVFAMGIDGTRIIYDDETDEWEYGIIDIHQYPSWMSFMMHTTLEKLIDKIPDVIFRNPVTKFLYHFIYGMLCSYPLIEVLRWSFAH